MSQIPCGSIHEGHEWFGHDSRGRQEIFFVSMAALLCEQFCRFAIEGAKIWISLLVLVKKKRENCQANLLYVESDFGTTDTTDISFTVLHPLRR